MKTCNTYCGDVAYVNTVGVTNKDGCIEALEAAADEIKRRAVELIGGIDHVRGYEITIHINPQEIVTVTLKKEMYVPILITGKED
jgi:hypothetical protein